ncbi:oxidoreductase [Sphingomonas ginkgonis]|uniref:Oxidoreductase n=1 Tax=Sphingomonas ginkgonis TaxID=2315330 RepID=A0A429V8N8_9SPHN|nr:Gfo/Idh/MocA family oxidoreductase [Sphingomonas ginkgonis]RST30217.1 oxidoreductase [Sphingomonas ginkgonis]
MPTTPDPTPAPLPPAPAEPVRAALIGRGAGGTVFHAPLLRALPEFQLLAVAGSAETPAVLADPTVELVVISTPTETHAALAAAALEAGKHVVIDKPMAVDVADADRLIALAAERGRLLTVFQNRRWDGDFLTVRRLLGEGAVGRPALFEACWDRFRPTIKPGWRERPAPGTGLLFDLGSHLLDQALVLFGVPEWIEADVAAQRPEAAVDDWFDLRLGYGPLRVRLSASTLVADPRPRFALHGSGGSFVKHGLDPQEERLRAGLDPRSPGFGNDPVAGTLTLADGRREAIATEPGCYLDFYRGVAAAIRAGAPPPVDPAGPRAGLRLIDLARRSAREGRRLPA